VGSFIGAIAAGAVGGGVGQALAAAHIGGFAGGAITGAASGFSGSLVTGIINNQPNLLGNVLNSTVMGAAIGGAVGALDVVYKNATNGNDMDSRILDGRTNAVSEHNIIANGDGSPKVGTSRTRNMAASKNNGITQSSVPANPSGTKQILGGVPTKTVKIPIEFEGNLTVTGVANPAPGETFQVLSDNQLLFSSNVRTPIALSIPSSNSTITWQLMGIPVIPAGAGVQGQGFTNSFLNIRGAYRGWGGFLFY
jgi:hypothetical protein